MEQQYNFISRGLHWLSAISIIGLFGVGLWMVDLAYYSQWYQTAPFWHKSVGLSIAAITLFRFFWVMFTNNTEMEGNAFENLAAKLAHKLIYLLLALIFISGYLISTSDGRPISVFNLFNVPALGELFENQSDISGEIHFYSAVTLMVLVTLHALAALKHHIINKDNTLKKMLGEKK
jgi:cytochrome b561